MFKSNGEASREKLLADFNAVIADTERLLKAMGEEGGERAEAVRAKMEDNLKLAKTRLRELEGDALARTRAAAQATDHYVREHPWQIAGLTAGVGLLVGLLLNRR